MNVQSNQTRRDRGSGTWVDCEKLPYHQRRSLGQFRPSELVTQLQRQRSPSPVKPPLLWDFSCDHSIHTVDA
jgi:hypothetical protein